MAIRDLQPGDSVEEFFALRKLERREYQGGERLALELGDATGRIDGVMWDGYQNVVDELAVGGVVKVRGTVGSYKDRSQIRVEKIRAALDGETQPADLLPQSSVDPKELAEELDARIGNLADGPLKELMQGIFGDDEFRAQYLSAAGGKLWHHNTVGGLAEHSLNVVRICEFACGIYPGLDRDLLVCGALLHDAGKIEQYDMLSMIDYSDEGRLVGHINSGDYRVTAAIRAMEDFPAETERALRHLIVSHQGAFEHGSPVVPQMPEAFVLYYADELDSKMGALRRIEEKTGNADWSDWVNLIGRHIYFGHRHARRGDAPAV